MSKKVKTLIVIAIIVVVLIGAFANGYNSLVSKQANVEEKHAAISTYLQRRADLIPNFVATVSAYSDYEKSTYTAVTEARTAVQNANGVAEENAANEQLDKAIDVWVNAVTEAYPDLKANTQYTALMDELAGSENRIATARKDYNDAAKSYNVYVKRFPSNIFAGIFGFEKVEYFEANKSAEEVPQVKF